MEKISSWLGFTVLTSNMSSASWMAIEIGGVSRFNNSSKYSPYLLSWFSWLVCYCVCPFEGFDVELFFLASFFARSYKSFILCCLAAVPVSFARSLINFLISRLISFHITFEVVGSWKLVGFWLISRNTWGFLSFCLRNDRPFILILFIRTEALEEGTSLEMLPERLRTEIAIHVHLDTLRKVCFKYGC